jgi:uncharacterized membrane protein
MPEWLVTVTEYVVVAIDTMALVLIAFGTLEAFVRALGTFFKPADDRARNAIWLRYGRWLIAGLTFQLAADILETSVRSDWQKIGQLGAIAVIRTFLNYFLEKDLNEIRERQQKNV